MGPLHSPCTKLDTHEHKLVTAVQNELDAENNPELYGNLPSGTPYVQKDETSTSIEEIGTSGIKLYTHDNQLYVQADSPITDLALYDLCGRTVAQATPHSPRVEMTLGSNMPRVLIVRVTDDAQEVSIHKIVW